jgi:hypothetical protein
MFSDVFHTAALSVTFTAIHVISSVWFILRQCIGCFVYLASDEMLYELIGKDMANLKIPYRYSTGVYVNHKELHDNRSNLSRTLHRGANPPSKLKSALK